MMYDRWPILLFDQQKTIVTLAHRPEHGNKLKQYLSTLTERAKINNVQ
jgi:hypothetical protein